MTRHRIANLSICCGWSLAVVLSLSRATGGDAGVGSMLPSAPSAAHATERARGTVPSTIDYVDGTVGMD